METYYYEQYSDEWLNDAEHGRDDGVYGVCTNIFYCAFIDRICIDKILTPTHTNASIIGHFVYLIH